MKFSYSTPLLVILTFLSLLISDNIYAHCDGLDGPVVKAAKRALYTKNINLVLIWIDQKDEGIIRNAFTKTLKIRGINKDVQEVADNYFFETLVRLHRQSEGEPYTGLKPAGRNLGPIIPAADLSIDKNSFEPLKNELRKNNIESDKVEELFNNVINAKNYNPDDVTAGRKYVKSYITFLHKAEEVYSLNNKKPDNKNDE